MSSVKGVVGKTLGGAVECVRWDKVGRWRSVHGELITQVVKNMVGGRGESAGVG